MRLQDLAGRGRVQQQQATEGWAQEVTLSRPRYSPGGSGQCLEPHRLPGGSGSEERAYLHRKLFHSPVVVKLARISCIIRLQTDRRPLSGYIPSILFLNPNSKTTTFPYGMKPKTSTKSSPTSITHEINFIFWQFYIAPTRPEGICACSFTLGESLVT